MKNLFITLDGVDGVGKTTVAKLIAENYSYEYFKSPSDAFEQIKKKIESPQNALGRYCFYRLATQYDSKQISKLLETRSVVCDRYIASTYAYHSCLDKSIDAIHSVEGITKPDFSFLLHASTQVRDMRIQNRNANGSDFVLEKNSILLDEISRVFFSLNLIVINTDGKKPMDIAEEIISLTKTQKNELKTDSV